MYEGLKIELGGRYAYRGSPTAAVHILAVGKPGLWSVVSMSKGGATKIHRANGSFLITKGRTHGYDLIELEAKPMEIWANFDPSGSVTYHWSYRDSVSANSGKAVTRLFREVV